MVWGPLKWFRSIKDPAQEQLAHLLAEEASKEIAWGAVDSSSAVALYVMAQPWSTKDASWRLLHAAMIVGGYAPELDSQADSLAKRTIKRLETEVVRAPTVARTPHVQLASAPLAVDQNSPPASVNESRNQFRSITELSEARFGHRFGKYCFHVGETFIRLRDVVANSLGYDELKKEGVGASFDLNYRGVSIRVPYRARFVNPANPEYIDPTRAAVCFLGTMVHELAHYRVPGHDLDFLRELQSIVSVLNAKNDFDFVGLKNQLINQIDEYQDVLAFLSETIKGGNAQPRVAGVFGYYPMADRNASASSQVRWYDLLAPASVTLASTKSEMEALLKTWLQLGEYQRASENYMRSVRELLVILGDSKGLLEFLSSARVRAL